MSTQHIPTAAESDPPCEREDRTYRSFQELMEDNESLSMRLLNQHIGTDVLNLVDRDFDRRQEAFKDALKVLDKAAGNYERDEE